MTPREGRLANLKYASIFVVVVALTATLVAAQTYSASVLPDPTNAPGLNQRTLNASAKAIVQDNFTGTNGTNIVGTTPEMQNRSNTTTAYSGYAPSWVGTLSGATTSGQWTFISRRAQRNTANDDYSMLLVPYLKRKTTAKVTLQNLTSAGADTQVAVIVGANYSGSGTSNATEGLAVSLWRNGSSWEFNMWLQTGANSSVQCSNTATVTAPANNNTTYTMTLNYDPSAPTDGATANVTRSAGGSWNVTSNCDLATAAGEYVGLVSYESSAAQFENFSVDFG